MGGRLSLTRQRNGGIPRGRDGAILLSFGGLNAKTLIKSTVVIVLGLGLRSEPVFDSPPFVPRRIILVTIDTIRADHLGSFGYFRDTSPFFDDLAAKGVFFRNAFSSMATTMPAHASIFTGLHPLEHGVLRNGQRLADSARTLAECLSSKGFVSAAFVGALSFFSAGGLDQGFTFFDEPTPAESTPYRSAPRTVARALEWLAENHRQERVFLWVHFFDPHAPYRSASRFDKTPSGENLELIEFLSRRGLDPGFFGELDSLDEGYRDGGVGFEAGKPGVNLTRIIDAYDSELLTVDEALRRLFEGSESLGFNEDSLWIITGDHGEGLGNHNWLGHGKHIYNEQIRVPLILYTPTSSLARAKAVDAIVEHVDLLPTLGVLLDFSPSASGISILGLLTGNPLPGGRYAFSQRREFRPKGSWKLSDNYRPGETFALQDREWKYIWNTEGGDEFYHLAADPYELSNLLGRGLPAEEEFRSRLDAVVRGTVRRRHLEEVVDPEALERLRSLGYLQ